jgi:hypothetical protein
MDNKRLVTRAQQLKSLEEVLRGINAELKNLEDHILKNQAQLTEYQIIQLSDKIQQLGKQKKETLSQLKTQQDAQKGKGEVGTHGKYSFYNLVGLVRIPYNMGLSERVPAVGNQSYYVKIYEVVNGRQFQQGGFNVYHYIATLTSSRPSSSENYWQSDQRPLTTLPHAASYSAELAWPSIRGEVKNFIEDIAKKHEVVFESIEISQAGKSFAQDQTKDLLSSLENTRNQLIKENPPK